MRIVQDFTKEELKQLLDDFYAYFKDGFEFEEFLKPFLEKIGLSEVVVTRKTGDGGVDLTAIKNGLAEINSLDSVKYKVQAKRNAPNSTIAPEKIDALRGNLAFNEKGLFITTARVTEKTKEQAMLKDPSKPVLVIDGIELIKICIERQIGFAYKPVFSKNALDEFTNKTNDKVLNNENYDTNNKQLAFVEKTITQNDIARRILSVPRYIVDLLSNPTQKQNLHVVINNKDEYYLTFCPPRNYLYINAKYKFWEKYKFILDDNSLLEHNAEWAIDEDKKIYINIK